MLLFVIISYFTFYHLYSILFYLALRHLFISKCKFPFRRSKLVCICLLNDNKDVKNSEMCRLGQIYHVSSTHILSNRSSCPKVLYKKEHPLKFPLNPCTGGKQLCQRLPFNKEETLTHVFPVKSTKPSKHPSFHRAPLGAASIVT